MNTALLIIDMQHALCHGEEAAHGIAAVIDKVNVMSQHARRAGATVVLVQHEEDEGPLQPGSRGWALVDGLFTAPSDLPLHKRSPNAFHGTPLHALLQQRGVSRLVVCGLQTEFCVDTSVRQALALGYDVLLASDAHSTCDGVLPAAQVIAHHNRTLGWMGGFAGRVRLQPAHDVVFDG